MDRSDEIREAIERNVKAVTLRPGIGRSTAKTVARLKPGLECEVTDGRWSLTVGMTENYGGTNVPGAADALGAAFVGGPVAMAYSRFDEATREEVHAAYLRSIESFRAGDGYRVPGEFVVAVGEAPAAPA